MSVPRGLGLCGVRGDSDSSVQSVRCLSCLEPFACPHLPVLNEKRLGVDEGLWPTAVELALLVCLAMMSAAQPVAAVGREKRRRCV